MRCSWVTGHGEFDGPRLPAGGKAIYQLPGRDLEDIDMTLTSLHYNACPGWVPLVRSRSPVQLGKMAMTESLDADIRLRLN